MCSLRSKIAVIFILICFYAVLGEPRNFTGGRAIVLEGTSKPNYDEHYHSPPLILPLQNDRDWKPANLSSIRCPDPAHLGPDEHRTMETWIVARPKETIKTQISGVLCHKARWVTRCEYTWYFSKTVSRKIEPLPPKESDCKEAIKKKEEGLLESKGFPPAACYWASTNDEEYEQVEITDHPATYDPYIDGVLDSIFVGGRCKSRICETVHDSTLWIEGTRATRPAACTMHEEEQLELISGIKEAGGSKTWMQHSVFVVGTNYPFMDAKGSCKLKYCGKSGLLLSNGLWFHILHTVRKEGEAVTGFWDMLPNCTPDREVGVLGEAYEIEVLEATIEDIMWDLDCFRTVEDLQHHKRVSLLDLFRLSRLTPGIGPAYTIKGKTLFTKDVEYVKANKIRDADPTPKCAAHFLKTNAGQRCVEYTEYDKNGPRKGHVMNGIMIVDGKVRFPHDRFHLRNWHPDFILKHEISIVHHPVIGNISSKIHDSIDENLVKEKDANAGDVIGGWVKIASSKISWFFKEIEKFVLAFVILIIFLLLISVLFKIRKRNKTDSKNEKRATERLKKIEESVF